LADLNET